MNMPRSREELYEDVLEVLRFYADSNNWESPSRGFAAQYDPELSAINKDKGRLARLVLKAAGR